MEFVFNIAVAAGVLSLVGVSAFGSYQAAAFASKLVTVLLRA